MEKEIKEKEPKELSALDIHYLINEFQVLKDSKVENIYQKESSFYINLHISAIGKRILKIMLPNFIYITENKEEMPEKPPQFCTIARKYLRNSRLREITQTSFERIIKIKFTTKSQEFFLIIELFSKGNIIICNKDMKIIYPLTHQKWKDRIIKGGQIYKFPESKTNIKKIDLEGIKLLIKQTKMDSAVTFLAKDLGLGGKYAEEICKQAKINKKSNPKEIQPEKTLKEINKLLKKEISINKILDDNLTKKTFKEEKIKQEKTFKEKKSKTEKILDIQKKTIEKQEKLILESTKKGDLIYANYKEIHAIVEELNKIRKKYSWKEIKEKLKSHDKIKAVDEKTGKIILKIN